MKRYAIVIEKAATNYGGYVPDLPGCVATGATVQETEQLLHEAITTSPNHDIWTRHVARNRPLSLPSRHPMFEDNEVPATSSKRVASECRTRPFFCAGKNGRELTAHRSIVRMP
jgi:hypothetical protein